MVGRVERGWRVGRVLSFEMIGFVRNIDVGMVVGIEWRIWDRVVKEKGGVELTSWSSVSSVG